MNLRKSLGALCLLTSVFGAVQSVSAQQPFATLQSGFVQSVYGTATPRAGYLFAGLAFASNGDLWVDDCPFNGGPLYRFQAGVTSVVHGTTVQALAVGSPFPSNAACGLTNHPDGTIYANTSLGVVNINASTGAQIGAPFGPLGNALGIAVDPQTKNLVYVGADCRYTSTCTIESVNPVTKVATSLAVLAPADANFVDGVYFDSTGNYIFLSNRSPAYRMTVLNRAGAIVQHVPLTSEPDGIAFHTNPTFVVTNNTNGTMTRFDFPANDFTQAPVQSSFATGGFRGDLTQVGADSCLYLSQEGTHFLDGSSSTDNSVVRICPGFVPSPGVGSAKGHMVGDGAELKQGDGSVVEYDFVLQCNIATTGSKFAINWKGDNEFKLTSLTASSCFDNQALNGGVASKAGFNTLVGTATGSLNGVPGAVAQFTFTDAGIPSTNETANVVITLNGKTVLSVSGPLTDGQNETYNP